MAFQLAPKQKKSLLYSTFILLVLAVFLLAYFFYYIPSNRETINKNGFLILKTIASNIQDKTAGRFAYYNNIHDKYVNRTLNTASIDSINKFINQSIKNSTFYTQPLTEKAGDEGPTDTLGNNISINNGKFTYQLTRKQEKQTWVFEEKISTFLEPILETQKEELFESFALVTINGDDSRLIYAHPDLAIRNDVRIDTLLSKTPQAYLTGIRDINSRDLNHKMFYYPFTIDSFQTVLCGFVETEKYNSDLRSVPLEFVYPLAIIFLLLIVFLPILKFYIMDSNEQVTIKDIALFGLSVFVGVAVLTLVLIQLFIWKGEQARVEDNLTKLSQQVESSLNTELEKAYTTLVDLDKERQRYYTSNNSALNKVDFSPQIKEYVRSIKDSDKYFSFDRISWINDNGMQVIKGEMKGEPVFTNVNDRNYFQVFKNNTAYTLNDASKEFGWEPIYSWTNAEFNITVSNRAEGFIAAMATKMYSVVNALFPAGYGFCIINQDGKVLLHSNTNRNLRENLFEKARTSENLQGIIAARQNAVLNNVMMYGKWHLMHIDHLKNMPYSLVTFYNKQFFVPMNLRILIFSALFLIITTFICCILWISLARVQLSAHPLVYCRLDALTWLTPNEREKNYYLHAVFFLSLYVLMFLVFIFLYNSHIISNFTIFSLVLLTPINVLTCLFTIRASFAFVTDHLDVVVRKRLKRKLITVAIIHLVISVAYYFASVNNDNRISGNFILFQVFFQAVIWFYTLSSKSGKFFNLSWISNFKCRYNWMVTLLVICLSVIPSAFYSWYAHNQEILQTIKKQQLFLAQKLHQRSIAISNNSVSSDGSLLSQQDRKLLLQSKGIYSINNTAITHHKANDTVAEHSKTFENFYFAIAEKVTASYNDPNIFPALQDQPSDNSWHWSVKDSLVDLWYPVPSILKTSNAASRFRIQSVIPPRFGVLGINGEGMMLIILIFLLIGCLYKWLRVNTEQVFLMKYLQTSAGEDRKVKKGVIQDYYKQLFVTSTMHDEQLYYCSDYKKYSINKTEEELNLQEKEVLKLVRNGARFYDYVWEQCNEKERYLLYDFAFDGLINYKNTSEIYDLIAKGIFIVHDNQIKLFSPGFRAYLIVKSTSGEFVKLRTKFKEKSTWQALRGPLILLLLGFASVIFFTQEAAFQKLLALAGGVGTLLTILPKIFSSTTKTAETS